MNVAQQVRLEKEQHPERFCPVPGCLWRVMTRNGLNPCQKHTGLERRAPTDAVPGSAIVTQLRDTLAALKRADYAPDARVEQRPAFLIGRAQAALESAIAELQRKEVLGTVA